MHRTDERGRAVVDDTRGRERCEDAGPPGVGESGGAVLGDELHERHVDAGEDGPGRGGGGGAGPDVQPGTSVVGEDHDGDDAGDIPHEGHQSAGDIQGERGEIGYR